MRPESAASRLSSAAADARGPFFGRRYRWLVIGVYALVATVCAGMAWLQLLQIERHVEDVARERGAVLFRLVELTRDWNASHGGVYVPVTESTQPNPYLQDPKRDIVSGDGTRLTKVNPAFMTRQIAELAAKSEGVQIHITSLLPIRPANKADGWETESLALFEGGLKERIAYFADPARPLHRYMAPLLVKPPCMKCHAQQGYQVGQIRGGISVSMPATGLIAVAARQVKWTLSIAFGTFVVVSLLAHFALSRMRRRYLDLADLTQAQDRIIAERTHEVAARAADLEREVDERRRGQQQLAESEARYRSVIESSQDGVVVLDQGGIVLVNERLGEILGYRPEDLVGKPFVDIIAELDRSWVAERHTRRLRGEAVPGGARVRLRHHNPKLLRIADIVVVPLHEGTSGQWVVTVKDITLQMRNERELQIAAAVFEHAAEGVMVTDSDNRILRVNPAFTSITGYTPGEVVGHNPSLLRSGRHDTAFYQEMWRALAERGHWEGEIWNRHKSGGLYVEWLAITTIPEDAEDAGKYVATFTDITKRKQAEELLRHKAQHDPLTDLPNRALFEDRLDGALAASRRYGRQFGLLAIDLDLFKEVNDSLGHDAGDELLVAVARHLLSCVREADTVARIGGDEFAVLLTEVGGAAEVEQVARRALELLVQPFHLEAGTARISASIGMALYPEHGDNAGDLRRNADRALYAVKSGGRNACRFYAAGV